MGSQYIHFKTHLSLLLEQPGLEQLPRILQGVLNIWWLQEEQVVVVETEAVLVGEEEVLADICQTMEVLVCQ